MQERDSFYSFCLIVQIRRISVYISTTTIKYWFYSWYAFVWSRSNRKRVQLRLVFFVLQLRTLFCVLLLLSKFANNCVWYSLIPYTSFGFHRSILAFKWRENEKGSTLLEIFDVSLNIRSKVAVFISNLQDFLALQCIFHAKWLYILFQTCITKSSWLASFPSLSTCLFLFISEKAAILSPARLSPSLPQAPRKEAAVQRGRMEELR